MPTRAEIDLALDEELQNYPSVPRNIARRLLGVESSYNQAAVSPKGALGLGQLMPATAKELGVDPTDWRDNIRGSVMYLDRNIKKFGSVPLGVAAYHAGPGSVEKAGGIPDTHDGIMSTKDYVAKIVGAGEPQPLQNGAREPQPRQLRTRAAVLPEWAGATAVEPISVAPPGPRPGAARELWNEIKGGFGGLGEDFREVNRQLFGDDVVDAVDRVGEAIGMAPVEQMREQAEAARTPEMRAAREKKWIEDDGSLGEAWTDWRSTFGAVAESLPATAATMAPAIRAASWAGKAAGAAAARKAAAEGISGEAAEQMVAQATARARNVTAYLAGGGLEGTVSGGSGARHAREEVMRVPQEVLDTSETYQAIVAQNGGDKQRARLQLAENAATQGFALSFLATAPISGVGDVVIARALGGMLKGGVAKRVGKAASGEALEETAQSGLEQAGQNVAVQQADPTRETTAGVLNAMAGGAVVGGVTGAPFGLLPGQRAPRAQPAPQSDDASAAPAPPATSPASVPPAGNTPAADTAPVVPQVSDEQLARIHDAGREDIADLRDWRPPQGDVPDGPARVLAEERATQAALARVAGMEEGDIGRPRDGAPYAAKLPAQGRLKKDGLEATHEVVQLAPDSFVIRAKAPPEEPAEAVAVPPARAPEPPAQPAEPAPEADAAAGAPQSDEDVDRVLDEWRGATAAIRAPIEDAVPDSNVEPPATLQKTEPVNQTSLQKDESVNPEAADAPPQSAEAPAGVAPRAPDVAADGERGVEPAAVDEAAHEAATSPKNDLPDPTDAQKEAGNYQKGHTRIAGMDVSVENPAGSKRRPEWPTLKSHYGYIRRTEGADGDQVDAFIKPGTQEDYSGPVFVVNQVNPKTGKFDETKAMVGFADEKEARAAYLDNYTKGWKGLRSIRPATMEQFKTWLKDGDTKKAFPEQTTQAAPAAEVERTKDKPYEGPLAVGDLLAVVEPGQKTPQKYSRVGALLAIDGDALTWKANGSKNPIQVTRWNVEVNMSDDQRRWKQQDAETKAKARAERDAKRAADIAAKEEAKRTKEPSKKKLENTGVDLRRHWELLKAEAAAKDEASGLAFAHRVMAATARAPFFEGLPGEGATPGTQRYMELARGSVLTFLDYLTDHGRPLYRLYGRRSKPLSKVEAFVTGKSHLDADRARTEFAGIVPDEDLRKPDFDGETPTLEQRLALLKRWGDEYVGSVTALTEKLKGSKTVNEAAANMADALFLDAKGEVPGKHDNRVRWGQTKDMPGLSERGRLVARVIPQAQRVIDLDQKSHAPALLAHTEAKADDASARAKPLTNPRLEKLVRDGLPDHRNGKHVTPEQTRDDLGLSSVGFGTWVAAKEDQEHLDRIYDAFHDLADTIGIHHAAVGLNGTLHFTLGALGRGAKAAATYHHGHPGPEGSVNVINLTKTRGDGTVAHEWGHALDYFIRGLSGQPVMNQVVRALKEKQLNTEALRSSVRSALAGTSWMQGSKRDGPIANAEGVLDYHARRRSATDFKREADRLGEDYWGNDRELFARAWEAYVLDTMLERQQESNYLVNREWTGENKVTKESGFRGKPYPAGDERKRFALVMRTLTESLVSDGGKLGIDQVKFTRLANERWIEDDTKAVDEVRNAIPLMYAEMQEEKKAKVAAKDEERRKQAEAEAAALAAITADEHPEPVEPPPAPTGPLTEDDLTKLFDEAAAELRENAVENPQTPEPGDTGIKNTPPSRDEINHALTSPVPAEEPAPGKPPEATPKAADLISDAAKLGVKGVDEALTALTKLFGGGKIQSFPGGFDEDAYRAAKPHFEAALKAFQAAGRSLQDLFKLLIQRFGESIKPYAIRFAQDMKLGAQLGADTTPSRKVAEFVRDRLEQGKHIPWSALFETATQAWGGKQSEGVFGPKDAYDAAEAGMNQYILSRAWISPRMAGVPAFTTTARDSIAALEKATQLLPTQTKRTGEQDEFQQFSTVPAFAYMANWVANVHPGESYLEPSAGIGGLAVFGKLAGANIVANELSARRAAVLRDVLPDARVFQENGEHLHAILPPEVAPTVVVMNPPFSASAGRIPGKRDTLIGGEHVEQALKRLQPGGRLVAIVGEGMGMDAPRFREWWSRIKAEYTVRANIAVDGSGYAKYGTTFDNRLLVIDKAGPTVAEVLTGSVKAYNELPALLEGVRNARTAPQVPVAVGREGEAATGTGRQPEPGAGPSDMGTGAQPAAPATGERPDRGGSRGATESDATNADGGRAGVGGGRAGGRGGPAPGGSQAGSEPRGGGDADTRSAVGPNARTDVTLDSAAVVQRNADLTDSLFETYVPKKARVKGSQPHPGALVESSAMAAVDPVDVTYTPNLPAEVITKGLLSDAQLEAVIYAGQAHQDTLPDGTRRGFFIGDGTGVGKGREIAGIILDNMRAGRKRAVWVSEKSGLMRDAGRDWSGIGQNAADLFAHNKTNLHGVLPARDGILFTTYATVASDEKRQANDKNPKPQAKRIDQLTKWLGEDFDGVIVFDEAHNLGNLGGVKGSRGVTEGAKKAAAGMELQKRLPKARFLYVSATGATEVANLRFATRLGTWGEGTAFATAADFMNKIASAGVAAMELVARDLKAMGSYIARSLSYDGVDYERMEIPLSPLQTDIYNELALAWQKVLENIYDALKISKQEKNANAKSAALSRFWSTHQRFFNQIVTSMQTPDTIGRAKQAIADGGVAVFQLVNTNEAEQDRQAKKAEEEGREVEELDFTPRDTLIEYVKNGYPVQKYQLVTDPESGKVTSQPVTDAAGNPVMDPDLIAKRDALIKTLETLRVPANPIDLIIEAFGSNQVAEVTGRSRRFVRERQDDGSFKTIEQKRGPAAAAADAAAFQDDKRKVLIFSDAGGTGFSFQADLGKKNQRVRTHFLLQPGWRADKAVQGLGRTHRSNQKQPPAYVLPHTTLRAQKRFISSIARRLDQLGALTKGQRQTGSQGLFTNRDNLESNYAVAAMEGLIEDMVRGNDPLLKSMGLEEIRDPKTGGVNKTKMPSMPRFLNRMLSLTTAQQDDLFQRFEQRFDAAIDAAVAMGTFDDGMQTLKALKVEQTRADTINTDARTKAKTEYRELAVTNPVAKNTWAKMETRMRGLRPETPINFYRDSHGKVFALITLGQRTDASGRTVETGYRISPRAVDAKTMGRYIDNRARIEQHANARKHQPDGRWEYESLEPDAAKVEWDQQLAEVPETQTESMHMLTGAMLPVWDRIPTTGSVVRTQLDNGERLIGRVLPKKEVAATLKRFGLGAIRADMPAEELIARIMKGETAVLANDWEIKKSRVSNEDRLELVVGYLSTGERTLLEKQGIIGERIQWNDRYFIPKALFEKVTRGSNRPVVDFSGGAEDDARLSLAPEGAAAPLWRSALQEVLPKAPWSKAGDIDAAQLVKWLEARQRDGAFKADELAWSGLTDWLAYVVDEPKAEAMLRDAMGPLADDATMPTLRSTRKVTREQVQAYLDQNGVKVTETMLGSRGADSVWGEIEDLSTRLRAEGVEIDTDYEGNLQGITHKGVYYEYMNEGYGTGAGEWLPSNEMNDQGITGTLPRDIATRATRLGTLRERVSQADQDEIGETQYHNYQLPGGKDYRELLLTLPTNVKAEDRGTAYERETGNDFRSSHFAQPNVLAHIRFNERTDADGNKVLFIEEIQSDWAQKGRRDGFRSQHTAKFQEGLDRARAESDEAAKAYKAAVRGNLDEASISAAEEAAVAAHERVRVARMTLETATQQGVPSAPFVGKTEAWVALAMKRMIRYAADNGFDSIAWTTGEQQADRYSLAKQVDKIRWGPKLGTIEQFVVIELKGDASVRFGITGDRITKNDGNAERLVGQSLSDVVGKEAADKIMATHVGTLEGDGLKIGGRGMISFYDKIVPQVANDVLKKIGGGKVGTVAFKTHRSEGRYEVVKAGGGFRVVDTHVNGETGSFVGGLFGTQALAQDDANNRNGLNASQPGFAITDAMRAAAGQGMPLFKQGDTTPGMRAADVQKAITPIIRGWRNAPKIRVEQSPPEGLPPTTRGVYRPSLGTVTLYADNLRDAGAAQFVLLHEVAGHAGLRGVLGDALDPLMREIYRTNPEIRRIADAQVAHAKKQGLTYSREVGVEEALADMAGKGRFKEINGWKRLVAAIRNALRKLGFTLDITDTDVVALLARAKEHLERRGETAPKEGDARLSIADDIGKVINAQTVQDVPHRMANRLRDFRSLGLQGLGRRQITDIYGDDLPALKQYNELAQQMDADKNESGAEADNLVRDWAKLPDERQLADLMHDATRAGIDPDKAYVEDDDKDVYDGLAQRFKALSPEAKKVYRDAREMYEDHYRKVQAAIRGKIERAMPESKRRTELLEQMDANLFGKVKGVYFPLARFGDYLVTVKNAEGETESVTFAETLTEAERVREQLRARFPAARGFRVGKIQRRREFNAARDAVGRGFLQQLFGVLDEVSGKDDALADDLKDSINQLYLVSLPDLSWAKHGIHRKGTPGFSQDARRAYANNMFHGARYLAKLRYADRLQDWLRAMQEKVDSEAANEKYDGVSAQQVVDEMHKRHDVLMNPKTNQLATTLTSLGFIFHLGLSPASAAVNLMQTPMVAYPMLAAKYGWGKSYRALMSASRLAMVNRNDLSGKLKGDEAKAYDEAVKAGVIDVTLAHDLAGVAAGEDTKAHWKMRPAMRMASFLFHHAERFNRQATFLAAYRMAREAGKPHTEAYANAVEDTYASHFDYSAGNRPRAMQGNVARVILLFKQFGQNMIYTMARAAYKAAQGDKEAQKALAGLLVTHALGAGLLGLPLVGPLLALASMFGGDDDEPWDAKVALRNVLADAIGQKPAEVLVHGLSRLTPIDISGRVGLDKLIFPDIQEGIEGADLWKEILAGAAGPVAGIAQGAFEGAKDIGNGHVARGIERMMPSAVRGPLRALRFEMEGVKDRTGVELVKEPTPLEELGQALGFTPGRVKEATEGKGAVYQAEKALNDRRRSLLTQYAQARAAKDAEAVQEAMADIKRFNDKNPQRRITGESIANSMRLRDKRQREAENGLYLPKKHRDVQELGRFAGTD